MENPGEGSSSSRGGSRRGATGSRRGRGGSARSSPFTIEENEALVDKFLVFYSYLCGVASKRTNQSKKNQLWSQVTDAVNAMGGNARSVEVVKKRYFDIKRQVRRKVQRASRAAQATGGGPAEDLELAEYEQRLYDHLGSLTFRGLEGGFDADAPPTPRRAPLRSSESETERQDPGDQASSSAGPAPLMPLDPSPSLAPSQASLPSSRPPAAERSPARQPGVVTEESTGNSDTSPLEEEYILLTPVDPEPETTPGPAPVTVPAPQLEFPGQSSTGGGPSTSSLGSRELIQEFHRQTLEQNQQVLSLLTELRDGQREVQSRLTSIDNTLSQMLACQQLLLSNKLGIPVATLFPGSSVPETQQAESPGSDDEQSTD